uniref:Si:dkey-111e8.4 n=1 Tax=Cyprinus carpio TaxID=7962 RepID=A0A8C2ID19_CYPCA
MKSGDSLSWWLNSDIFIVFVVLLLLLLLVVFAVCWLIRRHHTQRPTEKMAEIEIIPVDGTHVGNPPIFTLKIVTEQTHATELVEMLTLSGHSIEAPDHHSNSAVTEDDDNDQDYTDALQNI